MSIMVTILFGLLLNTTYQVQAAILETMVISDDPIHPYIHELFQSKNTKLLKYEIRSNGKNVTNMVKIDLKDAYNRNDTKYISEYLEKSNVSFIPLNNDLKSESIRINSTTTLRIVKEELITTQLSDPDYPAAGSYTATFILVSDWVVYKSGDKIFQHGAGSISVEGAYPYGTEIASKSASMSILNNGYTSKFVASFRVKKMYSNGITPYYRYSPMIGRTYYYHSIVN